ncbi:MAG: inositol monophosphatase [Gammaproteobacteria bacterium]|nr:inositol monophosphatase [Gammaproteobacteria bacterium]|tara:strand:+ start:798 stop:1547 length:750 start_codon:yes stop_codon:yes gene_type:complete
MDKENFNQEIAIATEAAKEAGNILINKKNKLNSELESSQRDTKLLADIESETLIKKILSAKSNYPYLAEEGGKSSNNLGDIFWVIDPLDGTANYSRNIPSCCISIALIQEMKPVIGVIYDFNTGDLYIGNTINVSASLNGKKITVSRTDSKSKSILMTGLPLNTNYSDEYLIEMIKDMQTWKKVRMIGSAALASCYVASGKADQYKEKGAYFWDVAAGAAIVESAGGRVEIIHTNEDHQVDVIFSNSVL